MRNMQNILFIVLNVFFIMAFFSCQNVDISERWAKNKFKEETGLIKGYTIDSVKRYAGQACVYVSVTNEVKIQLLHRFTFMSNKEFLVKFFNKKGPAYVEFPPQLYNLESASENYLYYLKTYTNSSGKVATSYYVTILSKKENKLIFTEAFFDL